MGRRHAAAGVGGALLAALILVAPPLRGQEIYYDGSLQFSTGDYLFTERTNSAYLFSGLRIDWDRVTLSADLPVIWQSTPWVSYAGGGPIPSGGPQHGEVGDTLRRRGGGPGGGSGPGGDASGPGGSVAGAVTDRGSIPLRDTVTYDEVGAGDPTLRLAVELLSGDRGALSVTLSGTVKAPLADPDAGFGTGEWDGGAVLGLSRRLGQAFLYADVGYWVYGDMPGVELADPVTYSAGVGLVPGGGRMGLLASVSGSSRILEGTDPPLELGLGVNFGFPERRSLGATISLGLTESSPDFSAGLGWSLGL